MAPEPVFTTKSAFWRGFLLALTLSLGPQLVTAVLMRRTLPSANPEWGVGAGAAMAFSDLLGFILGSATLAVGASMPPGPKRGFLWGAAMALGSALLVAFPLCSGVANSR